MDKNFEELQYLFQKENWEEMSASSEPNASFNVFMDTFSYYFTTMFLLKATSVKDSIVNNWIAKGISTSRNNCDYYII
jgi:hypothetical protein